MLFRIYKGNTVTVEGESPLTISDLSSNTTIPTGEYQVVKVVDGKESERVDIPSFTTLPIRVESVSLKPNEMNGTAGTPSDRQMSVEFSPRKSDNQEYTYSVEPETNGLTIDSEGTFAWTDEVPSGTYTVKVTSEDGNKVDTSTLTLSEPEDEPEEPEDD